MLDSNWRSAEKWGVAIAVIGVGATLLAIAWAVFIWYKPTPTPPTAPAPTIPSVGNVVQGTGGITQIGNGNQIVVAPSPAISQPQQPPSRPKPETQAEPSAPAPELASETLHVEAEQSAPAFDGEIMVSLVGLSFEGDPLRHRVSFTVNDTRRSLSKTYQRQDVGSQIRSGDFTILVKAADTFSATFEIRKQPTHASAQHTIQPAPNSSGPATTYGPKSPAITGTGNSVTYGDEPARQVSP